jgi:Pectate lyase superfamily protein
MPRRRWAAKAALFGVVSLSAAAQIAACGSSSQGPPSHMPRDGGSLTDVSTERDVLPRDAPADTLRDAPPTTPPYGDRNLGLVEPYPDSLLIQNGGRFYNLRSPPTSSQHAATGNGTTDDTAAFLDAFDFLKAKFLAATGVPGKTGLNVPNSNAARDVDSYWLYLPDGTYLVSGTLIYRGEGLQQYYAQVYDGSNPFGTPWFDLSRVRIVGQSREGTVIQLADNAPGFDDASTPTPVITFQHPDTTFDDWNADNLMKNITVDTGKGNPGAVGILAQGANSSGIRNVLVRSGDGAGVYGIWLPIGPVQGCYHDITIVGFDYGVGQTEGSGTNGCFENLTVQNQAKAGILVTQANFVVRNLLAEETSPSVPAALMNADGAQLLVIDSSLSGSGGPGIVVTSSSQDSLFVRNVVTSGYASAVSYGGAVVAAGPMVTEYSSGVVTLFDAGTASLDLPVEQVPIGTWYDADTQWASVESYRTDAAPTDTEATQAALSSGKPVVVFPRGSYSTDPVTVPASVERVDLLYANLDTGGEFDVTEASSEPLFFENGSGATYSIVVKAQREVVARQGSNLTSNPDNLPVKLFVENGGSGYLADFVPTAGKVWARGLDIEYRTQAEFVASGGMLWIMGYKTEGSATVLSATGGSMVEVLSGYSFLYTTPTDPMIVNQGSSVSFIGTQTANGVQYNPVVSETQGSVTHTAAASDFPAYVGEPSNDFVIPLYVGRAP